MKKNVVVILITLVALSVTSLLPVTRETTINISAGFDNTLLQVINLDNWKHWYPQMKVAYQENPASFSLERDASKKNYTILIPGRKYMIHVITPMSYVVSEANSNWKKDFAFTVLPGNTSGTMNVNIVQKIPFLFTIFGKNEEADNSIKGLKSYLEDSRTLYGFGIQMSQIRDSVIASSDFRIRKKYLFLKIHTACESLMHYITENGLIKTGPTSISYNQITGDSIRVTVGIPVNKTAPAEKDINCLSLPAKGKVLVGNYEGKFSDREKIYLAMSKYLTDHSLSPPAESFERYLNDSIPSSDSSLIRMELNYPVY